MTKYKILLDEFNSFMEDSHIRKYCSEICKGKCCTCEGCAGKFLHDFKQCHTNLACSSFICFKLNQLFRRKCNGFINLLNCEREIKLKLWSLFKIEHQIQANSWPKHPSKNIYFTPYSVIELDIDTQFPIITKEELKIFRKIMDEQIRLEDNNISI